CEVGLDSQIGRQRFISLLFLLRARRVTGRKRTSTIRISPFLPQSGPNASAQGNETGSPESTSKTLSIVTLHQPTITLLPMGEGAAKRRMRADHPGVAALTGPSATRSQWERDTITLLPTGEGAAKRRMRADHLGVATLTGPSATLSQWERDTITLLPTG